MRGGADAEFTKLATGYLDDRAERHPDLATGLGDHRFDDCLADLSPRPSPTSGAPWMAGPAGWKRWTPARCRPSTGSTPR